MYLDYFARHKMADMQQEANHQRLIQQLRKPTVSPELLSSGVELLGRQFIRLGTALTNATQSNVVAMQPECVTC